MASGEFHPPRHFAVQRGADGIEIGDIDNDGHNELVVANRADWSVCLLRRDRHRPEVLRRYATIRTSRPPAIVVVADVNRDDLNDLIIAHYDDYQGSGKSCSFGVCFQDPVTHRLGKEICYRLPHGNGSRAIAVGDIDGDGHNEVVVANESQGQKIYYWTWDKQQNQLKLAGSRGKIDGYVVSISIADVTGDGRNDVVLHGTRLFVFTQQPGGGLDKAVDYGRTGGESADVGDVTGDGLNDVVGATAFTGKIAVWRQTRSHRLKSRRRRRCGIYTEDVEVADLNQDGRLDVAVACRDRSELYIFHQTKRGELAEPVRLAALPGKWFNELAVGDLNGDGVNDIAGSYWGSQSAKNPPAGFVSIWFSQR